MRSVLLLVALLAGGCGGQTLYRATPEDTRDLTTEQAKALLVRVAGRSCRNTVVSYDNAVFSCTRLDRRESFRFAESPTLVSAVDEAALSPTVICIGTTGHYVRDSGEYNRCMFFWWDASDSQQDDARDLVRAWYVLARASVELAPKQEAAFELAAQSYRDAAAKPQLPEEAVKYKVQAELAVQQKRYDDAVGLYDQALAITPWWPQGHYNRGLILGELKDYGEAARALQRYLKLEPDAANARAVQLKIYQWEGLAKAPAK